MSVAEYLVIEQPNGWWVMHDDRGMGPYPNQATATKWAVSTARLLENAGQPARIHAGGTFIYETMLQAAND